MKNYCSALLAFALILLGPCVFSHGRSEETLEELNAKAPEWLTIGEPIKATPATEAEIPQASFRSRSGGATNSRNRVNIPSRGIELELEYEIDWIGNNEIGTGVSLSPDGKRLLVNSGPVCHLYQIQPNGKLNEITLRLPHVTYDAGLKGYLRGWSWADDQTLVANAEITDDSGHNIIENRVYVFHMKEEVLRRLDLTALNLTETDGIEVFEIGSELSYLKFSIGRRFVTAKADWKRPPTREEVASMPIQSTGPVESLRDHGTKQIEEQTLTAKGKAVSFGDQSNEVR